MKNPPQMLTFLKSLILITLALLIGCSNLSTNIKQIETVAVKDVLEVLSPHLSQLKRSAEENQLKIKSLKLTFQTVMETSVNAGFSLLVFSAGGSEASTQTSSYTITLTELKSTSAETSTVSGFFKSLESLVKSANTQVVGLGTSEIKGNFKFVIVNKLNAGVKEFEIKPISVDFGGTAKQEHTHVIEIVMTRIETKSDAV